MGKRNKYRNYSLEDLDNAIQLIQSQAISIRAASKRFNVPKSTIIDKLNNKSSLRARSGPSPVLSESEENQLVEWLINMAKIGYGQTRQQLLLTVKKILDHDGRKTPFKNNLPGKDWFYAFLKRHPEITNRTPQKLGKERAKITWQKIVWWFQDFAKFLTENTKEGVDIMKDPSRIYNADESGFPQDPKSGRILAPKGSKNVYTTSSSEKSQITVLACMSGSAHYLPPMLVFPGERFRAYNPLDGFPEAILGRTKSGWMDSELFFTWVKDHFVPHVNGRNVKRPLVLLVDGHTSHISLEVSKLCNDEGIILYCLLEHGSHILQPCDVSLFGPLKKHWRDSVREFQCRNPGEFVTKSNFASVFRQAWAKGTTVDVAVNGFMHTGLYPFSYENVDKSKVEPSVIFHTYTETQTDISSDTSQTSNVKHCEILIADDAENDVENNVASLPVSDGCDIITDEIVEECNPPPTCLYPHITIITEPLNTVKSNLNSSQKTNSSFDAILVTPKQQNKQTKRKPRLPLPKAVSGREMINILEERKRQKKEEADRKEKRKVERDIKRKLKEEEKAKKEEERIIKKRQRLEKSGKNKTSNNCSVCVKCKSLDSEVMVCCEICSSLYHAKCCGIDFTGVHPEDIASFPFECDLCIC